MIVEHNWYQEFITVINTGLLYSLSVITDEVPRILPDVGCHQLSDFRL